MPPRKPLWRLDSVSGRAREVCTWFGRLYCCCVDGPCYDPTNSLKTRDEKEVFVVVFPLWGMVCTIRTSIAARGQIHVKCYGLLGTYMYKAPLLDTRGAGDGVCVYGLTLLSPFLPLFRVFLPLPSPSPSRTRFAYKRYIFGLCVVVLHRSTASVRDDFKTSRLCVSFVAYIA